MSRIVICPECKESFKAAGNQKRKYCSIACMKLGYSKRFNGKGNPNYRHGKPLCPFCGKEMSRRSRGKYCADCQDIAVVGENNPFYGKVHSQKTKEDIKKWHKTHDHLTWVGRKHKTSSRIKQSVVKKVAWQNLSVGDRQIRLARLRQNTANQLNHKNKSKPEKIVESILSDCKAQYISNHPMYGKFFVDFYLPLRNAIIEVFGDYWHANPVVYPADQFNIHQQAQVKKDKARLAYLRKCGHNVLVVWEKDIKENLTWVRDEIMAYLR